MKQMKSFKNFLNFLQKYKKGLEESTKGTEFFFDSMNLLHYKCHKISLNCSGSYIDSPKWLKNKKATKCCDDYIKPKNIKN